MCLYCIHYIYDLDRFTRCVVFVFFSQALHAISGCRMSLLSPHLTFHFVEGDSVVKHPSNQVQNNIRC